MFRIRTLLLGTLLVGLILVSAAAVPALAGKPGQECKSTRAANELVQCVHCQAMKQILNDPLMKGIRLEVHPLDHGAVVELAAADAETSALMERLVTELWGDPDREGQPMSASCAARADTLKMVNVDRAATDDGMMLVISSEDPKLVDWIREDASSARSWVLAAASR